MEKLADGYGLVEGPLWVPDKGLLFTDVQFGGVDCLRPDGVVEPVFKHRRGMGGLALHAAGGLVVSGRNVSFKSFEGGPTRLLLDRDLDNDNVGYNDLTTDEAGRIYVGSLGSSPVFEDGREPTAGQLWLIDLDGSTRPLAPGIELTNGLGFSPDGKLLYHSDSRTDKVWVYDVFDDGGVSERRPFADTAGGVPDGLAVAADGSVWVALAQGGAVGVWEADGRERERIPLPQPMVTSLCFGGDDLCDLYVVTGSRGMEGDRAGSVYRRRVDVPGLAVPLARVDLPADASESPTLIAPSPS